MGSSAAKSWRLKGLTLAFLLAPVGALAECSENSVQIRGDFGKARFTVEVADDNQERAQGLMFREHLPTSSGMLFLYERPTSLSFWMRNTLIELDIIFIDETGTITHVHDRAQPLDETPITGGRGLAVLEINGGLAKRLGIAPGNELQHPYFADGPAAWPC